MVNQLAQADLGVGVDFKVHDTSPDTVTFIDRYHKKEGEGLLLQISIRIWCGIMFTNDIGEVV